MQRPSAVCGHRDVPSCVPWSMGGGAGQAAGGTEHARVQQYNVGHGKRRSSVTRWVTGGNSGKGTTGRPLGRLVARQSTAAQAGATTARLCDSKAVRVPRLPSKQSARATPVLCLTLSTNDVATSPSASFTMHHCTLAKDDHRACMYLPSSPGARSTFQIAVCGRAPSSPCHDVVQ